MPFTQGHPKYGGRTKGRANHATLKTREDLLAFLERERATNPLAHPFQMLFHIMTDPASEPQHRLQAAIALGDRLLPKLKAVELSGDPERPLTITSAEARQARIAALLAQRNGHEEDTS